MRPVSTGSLKHWLALIRTPGVGASFGARLLETFGDPEAALNAGRPAWTKAGIPASLHDSLANPDWSAVERDETWLAGGQRGLITWNDERYPAALREISHAPLALFYQGDASLLVRPQLAVVGARSATAAGLETAHDFAAELTRRGLLIVSGLALGIDGAAHRGALQAGGSTVAVCATGLDRVYPARHRELAHEIAQRGLLISEFPTGTPPLPDHFPRRNRLISGVALGVLVVEAARRSGSLITARLALEQGREVFAIPGSIHSPLSRGGHALIRQGAKLTETVDDILEELTAHLGAAAELAPRAADQEPPPRLDDTQQNILDALGFDATSFDTLVQRLKLPLATLSSALLALELTGHIAAAPGGAYQRLKA